MTSLPAIETFGLTKRYAKSRHLALNNLNLAVRSGEIYGFLGPNGAGKTTTIRLLMNFIQPTTGHATILNQDVVRQSIDIHGHIGYLPGEIALYSKMTGNQLFDYLAGLQPVKSTQYLRGLISRFQPDTKKKINELSKGNRQKLGIIQAFMHQPDVLILDEPTSGLDPLMQEVFYELVRETKARGGTIFVSSHNLTEVQKMCDRVGFVRGGKLIAEQDINDLSQSTIQTYDIAFAGEAPISKLKQLNHIKVISNTPHHVTVTVRGELKNLLSLLGRCDVVSIEHRDINLEDEFLKFYKGDKER